MKSKNVFQVTSENIQFIRERSHVIMGMMSPEFRSRFQLSERPFLDGVGKNVTIPVVNSNGEDSYLFVIQLDAFMNPDELLHQSIIDQIERKMIGCELIHYVHKNLNMFWKYKEVFHVFTKLNMSIDDVEELGKNAWVQFETSIIHLIQKRMTEEQFIAKWGKK